MAEDIREYGWDDEIENDGQERFLLPEGEYPFTVTKFERGRSKGNDKMPPCNMAILTLNINEQTYTTEYLVLNSRMEWKLSQFFVALGLKKHGERVRMNWQKVLGASGMCRIKLEEYTGDDGAVRYSNKVDAFLDPEKVPYRQPVRVTQSYDPDQPGQPAPAVTSQPQRKSWKSGTF